MKKNNILSVVLVLLISVFISSCDTWIDPDINNDPNNPLDVPMSMILPSIQTNMAYDLGGNDAVRTLGIWMQYFNGVDRQSQTEGRFIYSPANCNNLWNSIYGGTGKDIYILLEKASVLDGDGVPASVYTRGVAKVLMADLLAFTTNLWNDIPYSEAFLGDKTGLMNPKLDTQEQIYAVIDQLLVDAIADLNQPSSVLPITGDMVYGGSRDSWRATAWALRARYALMLQKRTGNAAYTNAIAYADSAIARGFTAATFNGYRFNNFGTAANAKNPLAQFMAERAGDLVMGSTFINMMATSADPRRSRYAADGTTAGSAPGTSDPGVLPGAFAAGATSPVYHMHKSELFFIKAEAYLMTANSVDAFTAFNDGVNASLVLVVGNSTVRPTGLPANAAALTLQDIIVQKYIANFGNVQGFNDWRRTGYPTLGLPFAAVTTEIARRYPYSQEEVTYNSNVSNVGIDITSRIWWDVL